jgi:hypothetical protein
MTGARRTARGAAAAIPAAAALPASPLTTTPGIPAPATFRRHPLLPFSRILLSFLTDELALLKFPVLAILALFPSPLLRFRIKTFAFDMITTYSPSSSDPLHFRFLSGGFSVRIRCSDALRKQAAFAGSEFLKQPGSVRHYLFFNF